jgi:hypothetical protein
VRAVRAVRAGRRRRRGAAVVPPAPRRKHGDVLVGVPMSGRASGHSATALAVDKPGVGIKKGVEVCKVADHTQIGVVSRRDSKAGTVQVDFSCSGGEKEVWVEVKECQRTRKPVDNALPVAQSTGAPKRAGPWIASSMLHLAQRTNLLSMRTVYMATGAHAEFHIVLTKSTDGGRNVTTVSLARILQLFMGRLGSGHMKLESWDAVRKHLSPDWWQNTSRGGNDSKDFSQDYVEIRPGSFARQAYFLARFQRGGYSGIDMLDECIQQWQAEIGDLPAPAVAVPAMAAPALAAAATTPSTHRAAQCDPQMKGVGRIRDTATHKRTHTAGVMVGASSSSSTAVAIGGDPRSRAATPMAGGAGGAPRQIGRRERRRAGSVPRAVAAAAATADVTMVDEAADTFDVARHDSISTRWHLPSSQSMELM